MVDQAKTQGGGDPSIPYHDGGMSLFERLRVRDNNEDIKVLVKVAENNYLNQFFVLEAVK